MDPALQMIIFAAALDDGPSKHAARATEPAVSAVGHQAVAPFVCAGHTVDPHGFLVAVASLVIAALITFVLFRNNK